MVAALRLRRLQRRRLDRRLRRRLRPPPPVPRPPRVPRAPRGWLSPRCDEDAGLLALAATEPGGPSGAAAEVDEGDYQRPSRGGSGVRRPVRAVPSAVASASSRELLPPAQRARRERSQAAGTASPVGRRDAGWSRDHPARRFGSAEHGLRRCRWPRAACVRTSVTTMPLSRERKLVDGRDPIGFRGLRL